MPRIDAPTLAEHQVLRRQALVEAAAHLLGTEGPTAVTPAAVAALAVLARTSTYQYFPSTAALISAGAEERFAAIRAAVAGAVDPGAPAGERISGYVGALFDQAVTNLVGMEGVMSLPLPQECRSRLRQLHSEVLAPVVSAMAQAGVIDPAGTVVMVNGAVQAAARRVTEGADPDTVRRQVVAFVDGALFGS